MEEKIKKIYEVIDQSKTVITLNDILHWLFLRQTGEWTKYNDTEFDEILLSLLHIYQKKKIRINQQSQKCIDYVHLLIQQD